MWMLTLQLNLHLHRTSLKYQQYSADILNNIYLVAQQDSWSNRIILVKNCIKYVQDSFG